MRKFSMTQPCCPWPELHGKVYRLNDRRQKLTKNFAKITFAAITHYRITDFATDRKAQSRSHCVRIAKFVKNDKMGLRNAPPHTK